MRPGRPIALLCLLAAPLASPVAAARAQDGAAATTVAPPVNPQGDELDGGAPLPGALPEIPEAAPDATAPGEAAPDDAEALPPASTTTAPAGTTPAAGATPTPPPYLAPGPDVAVQPVTSVSELTAPDVPLEPLRLASLVAVLLAALLLGSAAALRTLGLRSSTPPVVATVSASTAGGSRLRVRERVTTLADDLRDFLRHSR